MTAAVGAKWEQVEAAIPWEVLSDPASIPTGSSVPIVPVAPVPTPARLDITPVILISTAVVLGICAFGILNQMRLRPTVAQAATPEPPGIIERVITAVPEPTPEPVIIVITATPIPTARSLPVGQPLPARAPAQRPQMQPTAHTAPRQGYSSVTIVDPNPPTARPSAPMPSVYRCADGATFATDAWEWTLGAWQRDGQDIVEVWAGVANRGLRHKDCR